MNTMSEEQLLARIAGDIIFSEKYYNVLRLVYLKQETITEFESNPRHVLLRHGIEVPDAIEVVIHDRGKVGKPARVDLHWTKSPARTERDKELLAWQQQRELARAAWDILHSPEMAQLERTGTASPEALKEFAANPNKYAAANKVYVPPGMRVIVHADDPKPPQVHLHFQAAMAPIDGCCYCSGGVCCYYEVE